MTRIEFVFSNGQKMVQAINKGANTEAERHKILTAISRNDVCLIYPDTKTKKEFIINPRNILYVKIE